MVVGVGLSSASIGARGETPIASREAKGWAYAFETTKVQIDPWYCIQTGNKFSVDRLFRPIITTGWKKQIISGKTNA